MVIYRFEASEELKKKNESSLDELVELEDGEPFLIELGDGKKGVLGFREGSHLVMEKIVDVL